MTQAESTLPGSFMPGDTGPSVFAPTPFETSAVVCDDDGAQYSPRDGSGLSVNYLSSGASYAYLNEHVESFATPAQVDDDVRSAGSVLDRCSKASTGEETYTVAPLHPSTSCDQQRAYQFTVLRQTESSFALTLFVCATGTTEITVESRMDATHADTGQAAAFFEAAVAKVKRL